MASSDDEEANATVIDMKLLKLEDQEEDIYSPFMNMHIHWQM